MLLVLPVLVAPLLPHAGALGPSLALAAALLAAAALAGRGGVLELGSVAGTGLRRPGRAPGADRLRTPIRSCDPDGRGRARPRAPGPASVTPA
jgi:hypothetical protein